MKNRKFAIIDFCNANNSLKISEFKCSVIEIEKNKNKNSFGIILSGIKKIAKQKNIYKGMYAAIWLLII